MSGAATHALPDDAPRQGNVSDILRERETVLWQGRPNATSLISRRIIRGTVKGLVLIAFGTLWMLSTLPWGEMTGPGGGFAVLPFLIELLAEAPGFFVFFMVLVIIGLVPIGFGVGMIRNAIRSDLSERRRTWYALTNQRAFQAIEGHDPAIRQWQIDAETPVRLRGFGRRRSVLFHYVTVYYRSSNSTSLFNTLTSYKDWKGFQHIEDGAKVAALMRQVKERRA